MSSFIEETIVLKDVKVFKKIIMINIFIVRRNKKIFYTRGIK